MNFKLEIVTPDGLLYDGEARKIILRTTEGDVGILPRHSDYVAPLSIGVAKVYTEDNTLRLAACSGGMVSVTGGVVRVVASTFEWSEDIDADRAERAREKAKAALEHTKKSEYDYKLAEAKLKKSLARLRASSGKG